jgi:hypothetical protein
VLQDGRVRGLRFSRNYGQHNALLCGIRAARNGVTITPDDDLQDLPRRFCGRNSTTPRRPQRND